MPSLPLTTIDFPYKDQFRALSPDELWVLRSTLSDELFGIKSLLEHCVVDGKADQHMLHTVFSVAEHRRDHLCKLLGIEMFGAAARDARVEDLRRANGRIRELESQLGQAASPEGCAMLLKSIGEKVTHWWDLQGFGYVREMHFSDSGGLQAQFSCSLHSGLLSYSDTPVSDREAKADRLATMQRRGFVLATAARGNDHSPAAQASPFRAGLAARCTPATG